MPFPPVPRSRCSASSPHLAGQDRADRQQLRERDHRRRRRQQIKGLGGHDVIDAGAGKDVVNGGAGNDFIVGGRGQDKLTGSSGRDMFAFEQGDTGARRRPPTTSPTSPAGRATRSTCRRSTPT